MQCFIKFISIDFHLSQIINVFKLYSSIVINTLCTNGSYQYHYLFLKHLPPGLQH